MQLPMFVYGEISLKFKIAILINKGGETVIYAFIAFFATTLGAVVGVGGGIIIRPTLAFLEVDKELASFTSSITVLVMAIVTLLVYRKKHAKIEVRRTGVMAGGSIVGGFVGAGLIPLVSEQVINIGYIIVLAAIILITVSKNRFSVKKEIAGAGAFLTGGITGTMSGFFGIGGGPFQMAALMLCFKMEAREAAVQSIFITALTTASTLVRYAIDGAWNLSLAIYLIPAAVAGGALGALLNRRIASKHIQALLVVVVAGMIVLQFATAGILKV